MASGRVLGRMPRKVTDPVEQLATLAGRVPHGPGRVRLGPELQGQAGWLVADRVGMAVGPMPAFDPSGSSARERWQTLVDVRRSVGFLTVGVSHALGVELAVSPLPRHELTDDRTVPAGRRNYLAPADVRALPVGVWTEAGPYTKSEWLARGVAGAQGRAAFLRVNDRSYLAAYETKTAAMWRLETTGRGAHHGLVADGTADDLHVAKDAARDALRDRFPDIAVAVDAGVGSAVVSTRSGWHPSMPSTGVEVRAFDERVAATVRPVETGGWQAAATLDGRLRPGPVVDDVDVARVAAEAAARGVLMELATLAPDRADRMVRELAATDDGWSRDALVGVIGHRLSDRDAATLATTQSPEVLVELMADSGVLAPPTMLSVLRAEGTGPVETLAVVPMLGMPVPDAIRALHRDWNIDRLVVGAELGAMIDELRAAGCTASEMLAAAPREELRRLDAREQTWMAVGPALLDAGYSPAAAVDHLAAHAPTPETFAAATVEIVERPVDAFVFAARRAGVEDLAALSERYGLSPHETAATLALACVPLDKAVGVVHQRCDGELTETLDVCRDALGIGPGDVTASLNDRPLAPVVSLADRRHSLDHGEPNHGLDGVAVDGHVDLGVDL